MADQKEPLEKQSSPKKQVGHASPRLESPEATEFQALGKSFSSLLSWSNMSVLKSPWRRSQWFLCSRAKE